MEQNSPINIQIPAPCKQNWDVMQQASSGRHCAQCNQVVYDFSMMDDDELLQFFKQQPSIHCGRFHNAQLNRDILPAATPKKLFISRFNKIAAALFAVLSFKSLASQANNKNKPADISFDANYKQKHAGGYQQIIISGTIKDSDGKPIEKAIVRFDSSHVAITDAEGKYSFVLTEVALVSHHLYFEYGDLIPVVRNYHPAMSSTNYDVVLMKRGVGFHTMGAPVSSSDALGALPSLNLNPWHLN